MTLEEAKKQIAKEYGYQSWDALRFSHSMSYGLWENYSDMAGELYARSKWDEACEAQKQICSNLLNDWEFGGRSQVHHFKEATKPEFKP